MNRVSTQSFTVTISALKCALTLTPMQSKTLSARMMRAAGKFTMPAWAWSYGLWRRELGIGSPIVVSASFI